MKLIYGACWTLPRSYFWFKKNSVFSPIPRPQKPALFSALLFQTLLRCCISNLSPTIINSHFQTPQPNFPLRVCTRFCIENRDAVHSHVIVGHLLGLELVRGKRESNGFPRPGLRACSKPDITFCDLSLLLSHSRWTVIVAGPP